MKKFRLFAIFAVALVLCLCAPFAACAGGETGGGDTSGASEEEDEQRTDSVPKRAEVRTKIRETR